MGYTRISVVAITVLLPAVVVGCAGQSEQTKKEIQGLQDRVAILQNERDRLDERLSALEQQQQILMTSAKSEPAVANDGRPPLRVVRLSPEDAGQSASPPIDHQDAPIAAPTDADETRVLISGSGTELTATPVKEAKK